MNNYRLKLSPTRRGFMKGYRHRVVEVEADCAEEALRVAYLELPDEDRGHYRNPAEMPLGERPVAIEVGD